MIPTLQPAILLPQKRPALNHACGLNLKSLWTRTSPSHIRYKPYLCILHTPGTCLAGISCHSLVSWKPLGGQTGIWSRNGPLSHGLCWLEGSPSYWKVNCVHVWVRMETHSSDSNAVHSVILFGWSCEENITKFWVKWNFWRSELYHFAKALPFTCMWVCSRGMA